MDDRRISKDFHVANDNLSCPCCNGFMVEPRFLDLMQLLRNYMGKDVGFKFLSGYLCGLQNERENGPRKSMHTLGRAWTLDVSDWSPTDIHKFLCEAMRYDLSITYGTGWIDVEKRLERPTFTAI